MFPIDRQEKIKALIQKEKTLKISALSKQFGVSEMTIYRDIKPLVEEGLITKSYGGITLNVKKEQAVGDQSRCIYCQKSNQPNMAYRIILSNDSIETACCAHCGLLRHRQLWNKNVHAICHDFFMNTTISATFTWFVMDTTLNIACCQPQVLTFGNQEHAEKFVKGFGGNIYRLEEAMEVVYQKMQGSQGCCNNINGGDLNNE